MRVILKKYDYEARIAQVTKSLKSVVQADSENAAAKLLTAQGFVPLKIELQDVIKQISLRGFLVSHH